MEGKIIVVIAILSVIIIACTVYLLMSKRKEKPILISDSLIKLFNTDNVINVNFVRNKVVVEFKDISLFDVNNLKEQGGQGISVVGDKVKFYISDKPQENEELFNNIKNHIEGQ